MKHSVRVIRSGANGKAQMSAYIGKKVLERVWLEKREAERGGARERTVANAWRLKQFTVA